MDRTQLLNRGVVATALVTGAAAFGLSAGGIVSTSAALQTATAPAPAQGGWGPVIQNVEFVERSSADCPKPRLRSHDGMRF